jgi:hypothetical protein
MIDVSIANFLTVGIMAAVFEALYRMIVAMMGPKRAAAAA